MIEDNRYYWSHLKTKTVTVRVAPKKQPKGVVFRVGNMIDLGIGRQTVMLEHVDYPELLHKKTANGDVQIPFRMGSLDFVYTSPKKPAMRNVKKLISTLYDKEQVKEIVADVLSPGDLLVFKQDEETQGIKMVEALRVVTDNICTKSKPEHAL